MVRGLWTILLCVFLVSGCGDSPLPPGTVASVNGEPVSLHAVQTLLDSRSAARGIPLRPSVSEMQDKYRHALSILVIHALVRQDLTRRGIEVDEKDVDREIAQIRSDFGTESLEEYFEEAFLREEDWRQLMRDQLAIRVFINRVLGPEITVSLEDVKKYFEEHREALSRPAMLRICYAVGESKAQLETWCEAAAADEFEKSPLANCIDTLPQMLPEPWKDEVKKLKPGKCGRILEQSGEWRTIALIKNEPQEKPRLSEIYGLIEAQLLEEKRLAAFDNWLGQKLASSKILVSPDLFPPKGN